MGNPIKTLSYENLLDINKSIKNKDSKEYQTFLDTKPIKVIAYLRTVCRIPKYEIYDIYDPRGKIHYSESNMVCKTPTESFRALLSPKDFVKKELNQYLINDICNIISEYNSNNIYHYKGSSFSKEDVMISINNSDLKML